MFVKYHSQSRKEGLKEQALSQTKHKNSSTLPLESLHIRLSTAPTAASRSVFILGLGIVCALLS